MPTDAVDPRLSEAVALHKDGRLHDAAEIYAQILSDFPGNFDATHLLGVIALQQGKFQDAQRLIGAALTSNPSDVSAMGNLGTSYLRDGQTASALQWFELAKQLQPDSSNVLCNVGAALHNMGRYREAIAILREAYLHDPSSYAICNLLGASLIKTGETAEAASLFEASTRADPAIAEGWANLSVALNTLALHERAQACADKAVSLSPQSPTALGALGAAQFDQGRIEKAIESYRQAASAHSPSAQIFAAYGSALLASGQNEEAIGQFGHAARLDRKNLSARWAIALAQLKPIYNSQAEIALSRRTFAMAIDEVDTWFRNTEGIYEPFNSVGALQPFYLAYQHYNNRDLLRRYGAICASWMTTLPAYVPNDKFPHQLPEPSNPTRKLRIGFASAHIHEHSVWTAITKGWVLNLDQSRFEIHLFQLSPISDRETEYVRNTITNFEDKPQSLSDWIRAIRKANLDILIYPEIGMHQLTLQLACTRLAPIQAVTWGHPETTGLPTMDLFISSAGFEPPNASDNYSEQLVTLPNLGVYVKPLSPAASNPKLTLLTLPRRAPLLLCPGSPFKYSPAFDEVWIQIARQFRKGIFGIRSKSRLVFFQSRSQTMDNMLENRLRAAFRNADVSFDEHVSIIPMLDRARFYGLMRRSALMLDTPGFSGFNTALQSIECNLPVLAFEGAFMRGRLASAIMRQLGLPELVATTKDEFVQKAIELASDSRLRRRVRKTISERRDTLFSRSCSGTRIGAPFDGRD